jgi:hypothetical protein
LAVGSPTRSAAIAALRQWLRDAGWPGPDDDDALARLGQWTYSMTAVALNTFHPDDLADQPDFTVLIATGRDDLVFIFGPI